MLLFFFNSAGPIFLGSGLKFKSPPRLSVVVAQNYLTNTHILIETGDVASFPTMVNYLCPEHDDDLNK